MGSLRSYWDFFFGFGLCATVGMLLQSVLLWQLANLARSEPAKARPFMGTLFVASVTYAILSWSYFFIGPLVGNTLIALLIGLAYVCRAV